MFAADTNRRFYAFDQETGDVLWQTILSGFSDMAPIAYAVGGRQYVAVSTGLRGGSPRSAPGELATDVFYPSTGNALYVFRLPD